MNINASLFVQMVVFFLGAWITMKYIWPPLINAIEERQRRLRTASPPPTRAKRLLPWRPSRARPSKPGPRPPSLVSDGEKRAQAVIDAAKAQAQVEADRIIEAAKAEAAQEMQRAREQLRGEVAALAVAGAEQILAREVDKTVHAQLLEQLKAKL